MSDQTTSTNSSNSSNSSSSRRAFLTAAAVVGAPAIIRAQTVTNAIKVGLVGCGGRGTGAASQALNADDYAELTAMGDIDASRIEQSLKALGSRQKIAAKIKVDPSKQYLGLDSYQKVIDSGIDVVLLATPPGFRPEHLKYTINAGKHSFVEKPVAVDAYGIRDVLATVEAAKKKNLSLVAGFCWRYSNYIVDTFKQLQTGAIGDLVSYYGTYYTSPVKPMPPASTRPAGMSDTEWQIRNWYNFGWLCGDSLVEQAIHTVDKVAWAMGDKPPISCVAVGGRQIPAEGGNIFDHFEVNYLYPNNVRAYVANRQMDGCYNENSDYIAGTKGSIIIGRGPNPRIVDAKGDQVWQYSGQKYDMYQYEHDVLFASLRKNAPVNDGVRLAHSTMLGIMGRMAAYTGQQITWDQALNSQERLVPEKIDWNGALEVAPMARPGRTKFI
ncbi:MAG: Gfo/Idh/MocA family oxidoreductase [Acidobacteria bacterium]|nr:Gfo/Idh/MocA family oxidoreductase [Acidobacteriota bacterium]